MHAQEFYDGVRQRAGLDSVEEAERATEAVLTTLGERTTEGAAGNVAEALPAELAEPLDEETSGPADGYDLEEFLARVADREDELRDSSERASSAEQSSADHSSGRSPQEDGGTASRGDVSLDAARQDARAVLAGVADAAPPGELADLEDQLPDEFARVLEPGERLTDADFVESVVQTSDDLDEDAAVDAATATLRTLGERLSEGEAADLATYLPPSFADPLVAAAPETPPDFPVEEFRERVAEREGTDEETAEAHAGAVLGVVAGTAGETELQSARSQLPNDYLGLFDRSN